MKIKASYITDSSILIYYNLATMLSIARRLSHGVRRYYSKSHVINKRITMTVSNESVFNVDVTTIVRVTEALPTPSVSVHVEEPLFKDGKDIRHSTQDEPVKFKNKVKPVDPAFDKDMFLL